MYISLKEAWGNFSLFHSDKQGHWNIFVLNQGRSQAGRLGGANVAKGPLSSLGGAVYKHFIYHSIIIYQHLIIE